MSLTEIRGLMIPDGQTWQFVRKPHALRTRTTLAILFCLLGAARSDAAELKQKTLQAWQAYVQTANLAMEQRAAGRSPFLWVDESPDLLRRVRIGGVEPGSRRRAFRTHSSLGWRYVSSGRHAR